MTISLFDHLKEIHGKQRIDYWDSLTESDAKEFNNWMINRFISMNIDYIPVVNEIQLYYNEVKNKELYLFYSQIFPKSKQYHKYIKTSKSEQYESWIIKIISKKYSVSEQESIDYLNILYKTDVGKKELRTILEGFGIDSKQLKRLKI